MSSQKLRYLKSTCLSVIILLSGSYVYAENISIDETVDLSSTKNVQDIYENRNSGYLYVTANIISSPCDFIDYHIKSYRPKNKFLSYDAFLITANLSQCGAGNLFVKGMSPPTPINLSFIEYDHVLSRHKFLLQNGRNSLQFEARELGAHSYLMEIYYE
ncbi:MAG TPA: hypothetical protein DEV59_14190 [Proteus sp.]|uniref:Uncharacterized protein n=1 Tax=Proteus hauseri ATCC 700826 TaxID=1354271 RepID=A0AAJ3HVH1_PROHU|nr:hypothetical protein [Proteus hauseri]OAT49466.1 hypothetical protein M997_0682 [Proteus hauseri ATCC 700826]QAV23434.1 hypothetical protein PH4a_08870 [Proteus hauseri]HCH51820.1 hypothetical protein [Proteus sp. (in: enterobacteria)]